MRHRTLLVAALALTLPLFAGGVRAHDDDDDNGDGRDRKKVFRAVLLPGNEVPAQSRPGARGTARFVVDDATITFRLSYQGVGDATTPPAAAHVHFAQSKVNGGVMFFLCGGGSKPACPLAPATVTGEVVATDIIGPAGTGIAPGEFAEAVQAIRNGLAYANLHTALAPGGEIRGQLND